MVLRLLAAAAEHWLGNRLNDYLRDPDEYRAITRHLLHLGGTIASTPRAITVTLDPPAAPATWPSTRTAAVTATRSRPTSRCPGRPASNPLINGAAAEVERNSGQPRVLMRG
jgi:hypothetical protein